MKKIQKKEKYYLINEESLNNIKILCNYNELINSFSKPEIHSLISQFKNCIPEKKDEFIMDLIQNLPLPYIKSIKNNKVDNIISSLFNIQPIKYKNYDNVFYYYNCEMIEEAMFNLVEKNDKILKIINKSSVTINL